MSRNTFQLTMRRMVLVAAIVLGFGHALPATAQTYPDKPIHFVVPFPPGGGADKLARTLATKLESLMKTTVLIENKPGGNGNIALEYLARAPADGYTVAMTLTDHIVLNPALYDKLNYDPIKDFTPVALLSSTPFVLAVEGKSGPASLEEVISMAKKQPDLINVGTSGANTRLTVEQLQRRAGAKLTTVPYQGMAQGLPDLLGGRIAIWIGSVPTLRALIESGKLRGIAITSLRRSTALPDVPTVHESGFPEFAAASWFGVITPAKTPASMVETLNAQINAALRSPEVQATIEGDGATILGGTSAQFAELLKADIGRLGKIAREANIKAN